MPFTVIRGSYHVRGYSPDGDSIRFQPDDVNVLSRLTGPPARLNGRGHAQLRIEAIDTLETHYSPPSGGGTYHQPFELAHHATDALLDFVGITDVEWNATRTTVIAASDGVRGHILARSVEKNGRPVAFVYRGDPQEGDGDSVFLEPDRAGESYNHWALRQGLAYPTYYYGLFADLREALTGAVETARAAGLGVHAHDRTTTGFTASSLKSITHDHAILPKLFRRLCEVMVFTGSAVEFKDRLEESQEPVLDLRQNGHFTHLDTFVEQAEGSVHIRLLRNPEELVFDPMPTRPADAFAEVLERSVGDMSRARTFVTASGVMRFA